MSKAKKRKARIKLNETLNKQLDAMQDNSALEVFEPKGSSELNFYNLISEAMEEEEVQNKKSKNKVKNKVKNGVKKGGKSVLEILLILIFCMLFVTFVYTILKISIL